MKKVLNVLLALLMVFGLMMPISAEEENVACIGNKEYATLNEAIENVKENDTITLLKNVDGATGISVPSGSNFTIDFAGFTYTLDGPGAGSTNTETNGFQLLKDSTIVFKNGTINVAKNPDNIKMIIQNYANLTLEDMTIDPTNKLDPGSKYSEDYALSINNGEIHFKGNTSILASNKDVISFDIYKFGNYEGVSVTFDDDYTGTIHGTILFDSPNSDTHNLTIKGNGNFSNIDYSDGNEEVAKKAIDIQSGTFSSTNAIKYLSDNANVNVILEEDVNESIVIPEGTTVNLDLNGHKITNTEGQHTITNNGTLTIEGEGIVDNISHAKGALLNKGTATILGGEFIRSKEAGSSPSSSGGNSWYVISNEKGGNLTFEDANVHSTGKFSSLVRNYGEMTINGGTFENGFIAIKSEEETNLKITDGTIKGAQSVQTYGNTEISGGNLEGQVSVINYTDTKTMTNYDSSTTITGGEIKGDVVAWLDSDTAKVDLVFDGNANVLGNVKVINHDKEEIEENEKANIDVNSGSFSSDVEKYLTEDAAFLNVDETYYAGSEENLQKVAKSAKTSIEIIKGIESLDEISKGVTVLNNSGKDITLNGTILEDGKEIEVKPTPEPTPEVDTSKLQALVDELAKLDPKAYTEESYKVLSNALDQASKILNDKEATQEEVNTCIDLLNKAKEQLKEVEPTPEQPKPEQPKPEDKPEIVVPDTGVTITLGLGASAITLAGATIAYTLKRRNSK